MLLTERSDRPISGVGFDLTPVYSETPTRTRPSHIYHIRMAIFVSFSTTTMLPTVSIIIYYNGYFLILNKYFFRVG